MPEGTVNHGGWTQDSWRDKPIGQLAPLSGGHFQIMEEIIRRFTHTDGGKLAMSVCDSSQAPQLFIVRYH